LQTAKRYEKTSMRAHARPQVHLKFACARARVKTIFHAVSDVNFV